MDEETTDVLERLRQSRSLPLLRLIDEAHLDGPVEPEPDAAAIVEPYRWLIERIGDGVRLTQAGYLPPALVTEAMTTLGWMEGSSARTAGSCWSRRPDGRCSRIRWHCGATWPRGCRMRARSPSATPD